MFFCIQNKQHDETGTFGHPTQMLTRNVSLGHGCPRYCQIRINRELSLAKGNNSWRHDAIWAILKLEDIMMLNNVTQVL